MGQSKESTRARPVSRETDDTDKRRCCCHPCLVLLVLVIIAAAGGIMIWQLLPEDQRNSIRGVVDSGVSGVTGSGTSSEAPTFDFVRCANTENCCNGVEAACDVPMNQVMFAGVHNAMSAREDGFIFAGNHEYSLEKALQAGFRAINMDVGNCGGELALVHNKCTLGRRDPASTFANINTFLDNHPREVLFMPLQINNDVDQPVDLFELYGILQSIPGFTDRMYIHEPGVQWPTMRELIDTDKRIIMFIYNAGTNCSGGDCPPGFHPYFLYASETQFTFETVEAIQNVQSSCQYDRGAPGYRDFYVVNNFVTNPLPSRSSSEVINQLDFLQNHVSACEGIVGREVSVVYIDFWDEGNLVDFVQSRNEMIGS